MKFQFQYIYINSVTGSFSTRCSILVRINWNITQIPLTSRGPDAKPEERGCPPVPLMAAAAKPALHEPEHF